MIQTALRFAQPPSVGSQCHHLLNAFIRGERLTVGSALELYGIYALSQRCGELKKLGWPIQSCTVKLHSGKRISKYWINK